MSVSSAKDDSASSESSPLLPTKLPVMTNVPFVSANVDVVFVVALTSPSLANGLPPSLGDPNPVVSVFLTNSVVSSTSLAALLHSASDFVSRAVNSHLVELVVSEAVPPGLVPLAVLFDVVAPVSSDLSSSA